jgi:membrane-associated protease RseP (regulator of RpoE activity)
MAEYLGVPNGLMVKQVAHKSEAASAGLKAFDVILKVGPDAVTTMSDWDRALRSNQGKPVQVTILRDKKQQTLTLQVDSKRKTGVLEMEDLFPGGDCQVVAELDPDAMRLFAEDSQASARALRDQALTLKNKIGTIDQKQMDEFRKQAEVLRDQLKGDSFRIDQKRMDELKRQMEEFGQTFKAEDFKIDEQQAEQLRKQAEELRDRLKGDGFQFDQKQMDEMKRQMEEFRKTFGPADLDEAPI